MIPNKVNIEIKNDQKKFLEEGPNEYNYLKCPYRLEIIPDVDEGGYVASYPELNGCITVGKTLDDVVKNAEEAKREWLIAALENHIAIPDPTASEYSGQFKLRLPKSLHRSLAQYSKEEGVSMNQYCVYLLSKNDAIKNSK